MCIETKRLLAALLQHQNRQLETLNIQVGRTAYQLDQLKRQVLTMEQDLLQKRKKKEDTFPTASDVQKLRESNMQLNIEVQLMSREFDTYNTRGESKSTLLWFVAWLVLSSCVSCCSLCPETTVTNVLECTFRCG